MNKTQRLQKWYDDNPTADSVLYGEHMHVGANQTILRAGLHGMDMDENSVVLDMACAVGGNARWIASLYKCRVYGNDIDAKAIEVANELAEIEEISHLCTFFVSDAANTELEDASCDLVVSTDIYDMPEIARVLKPGGRFLLSSLFKDEAPSPTEIAKTWNLKLEMMRNVTELARTFHHAKEAEAHMLQKCGIITNKQLIQALNDIISPNRRGGHHLLVRWRKHP